MAAAQAMIGQGVWPMTVFLPPDREPFYCGTYYPRDYFARLVLAISSAWTEHRQDVTGQDRQITAALAETTQRATETGGLVLAEAGQVCDAAVAALAKQYDARRGGFGGAPKFPPSPALEFLLRHCERAGGESGDLAFTLVAGTAEAMARGGIYDQGGGGRGRDSTEA